MQEQGRFGPAPSKAPDLPGLRSCLWQPGEPGGAHREMSSPGNRYAVKLPFTVLPVFSGGRLLWGRLEQLLLLDRFLSPWHVSIFLRPLPKLLTLWNKPDWHPWLLPLWHRLRGPLDQRIHWGPEILCGRRLPQLQSHPRRHFRLQLFRHQPPARRGALLCRPLCIVIRVSHIFNPSAAWVRIHRLCRPLRSSFRKQESSKTPNSLFPVVGEFASESVLPPPQKTSAEGWKCFPSFARFVEKKFLLLQCTLAAPDKHFLHPWVSLSMYVQKKICAMCIIYASHTFMHSWYVYIPENGIYTWNGKKPVHIHHVCVKFLGIFWGNTLNGFFWEALLFFLNVIIANDNDWFRMIILSRLLSKYWYHYWWNWKLGTFDWYHHCHFDGNVDCCHDYYNDEKSFWPASRPAALGDWTALESRWKRGLPVAHSESYFI